MFAYGIKIRGKNLHISRGLLKIGNFFHESLAILELITAVLDQKFLGINSGKVSQISKELLKNSVRFLRNFRERSKESLRRFCGKFLINFRTSCFKNFLSNFWRFKYPIWYGFFWRFKKILGIFVNFLMLGIILYFST